MTCPWLARARASIISGCTPALLSLAKPRMGWAETCAISNQCSRVIALVEIRSSTSLTNDLIFARGDRETRSCKARFLAYNAVIPRRHVSDPQDADACVRRCSRQFLQRPKSRTENRALSRFGAPP